MRNLLFLSQRIPFPPFKGEKIRPFHIIRHLAKSCQIHLGCLIDDPHDWDHVGTVEAFCKSAYFAPLDRRVAKLTCLRGLLTGQPLSFAFFWNKGLADWVAGVLANIKPDVVFIFSSNMAPYALNHAHRAGRIIMDFADVDSEKWRAYADTTRGPMRWVYAREARKVRQWEERIAAVTDASTFVSDAEAELFRKLVPQSADKTLAISNGVDAMFFRPDLPFEPHFDKNNPTFVFTGTMDYRPNIDAVSWFAEELLPRIHAVVPNAQFFIVGANPAPSVQRLSERPGVHVTGRVPDVRPYLAHAAAVVAPLRIARGIQNKVLEAMSMGKVTIVTPEALEGINAQVGQEIILARTAEEFIAAACHAAAGAMGGIGIAARKRIIEEYSWENNLRRFDALVDS